MSTRRRYNPAASSGTIILVSAVVLMLLLGILGLVLDLGYLYVVRSELQRAADAGALAGARALYFPEPSSPPECSRAQTTAWAIAQANTSGGFVPGVSTPPGYGVSYGNWNWSTKTFTPGCSSTPSVFTNAVTIRTTRENIPMLFAVVMGFGPRTLNADSLACMDYVTKLKMGAAFVMAINKKYCKTAPTPTTFYVAPDPSDTGGWYAKDPTNPSAGLIKGYLDNPGTIPAIGMGDLISLNNGAWADVLRIIKDNYVGKTVWVPVVDAVDFTSSTSLPVVGFAPFTITEVNDHGSPKYVQGLALPLQEIPADLAEPGGVDYGLLSTPRLAR